jgi:hypothetical protein
LGDRNGGIWSQSLASNLGVVTDELCWDHHFASPVALQVWPCFWQEAALFVRGRCKNGRVSFREIFECVKCAIPNIKKRKFLIASLNHFKSYSVVSMELCDHFSSFSIGGLGYFLVIVYNKPSYTSDCFYHDKTTANICQARIYALEIMELSSLYHLKALRSKSGRKFLNAVMIDALRLKKFGFRGQ